MWEIWANKYETTVTFQQIRRAIHRITITEWTTLWAWATSRSFKVPKSQVSRLKKISYQNSIYTSSPVSYSCWPLSTDLKIPKKLKKHVKFLTIENVTFSYLQVKFNAFPFVTGAMSTGNIGWITRSEREKEFGRAPSMTNCLSTTVPVNLAASQIAGRHTPTRNSLRHSRMIVMHRTGNGEFLF